jgi:NAD(P)-dependent dehydrogenase (short-subunit alcohol dehydrogenase family)
MPPAWDEAMAVNVTANYHLIRAMDPLLRRSAAGRAVFVTSGAATSARAYAGPYSVSKAALNALARTYADETHSTTPVRVNLFNPGPTRTRMRAQVMPGEDPMTLPTPEQVAEKILELCLPSFAETGKLYDYRAAKLLSFVEPA